MHDRKAHVITILNLKGGVGKTHTTWLLAAVAQERRARMLVVDLDTQGNLSRSLLKKETGEPEMSNSCVAALFDPASEVDPRSLVRKTAFGFIDLIPATPRLAPFDLSDQSAWQQSDLQFSLVDAISDLRADYDFIVFDCPPRLSLASFAALCASEFVVIPLEAADWGAQGIVQVTAAVEYVRNRYNPKLALLGYLVSRFKRARQFQRSYLAKLREHFGIHAFDTLIPDLARFEQSVAVNRPITLYAPSSIEAGIARRLFAEIQRRISRSRHAGTRCSRSDVPVGSFATTP